MPEPLHEYLRRQFPKAKQTTLREMLKEGRVKINGRPARRFKDTIFPEDHITIGDRPRPSVPSPSLGPLVRVFEDADLLVINKPPGLLTSTVPAERRPTALAIIQAYIKEQQSNPRDPAARVGLIHRLDRDASGLLVFSKSDLAYRSLKQQFFEHTVRRVYLAVTRGTPTPPAGKIESRLVELPDGTVRRSLRPGGGDLAVTEYTTIARQAGYAALRVTLHTGRKHQIRVHLHDRGTPIVGDRIYGKDESPRLLLTAVLLGFKHPRTGKNVKFEIKAPEDFPGWATAAPA